jgi:hypothetical protein
VAESRGVLITVALIGAAGVVIAALIASSGKESTPGSSGPPQAASGPTFPTNLSLIPQRPLGARPSVFLSRDSGPAGTVVRVSGEGFTPGERVVCNSTLNRSGRPPPMMQESFPTWRSPSQARSPSSLLSSSR